jgi:TolB-like protein/Tfp pilus assembly protein PilF
MATTPNKISQFWQELKRRNVVRVVTVYAGAGFVILELVDIIAEPLKLPSWLLPVVIVLLSIGFVVAIILSWIYDIHPEGGMVKTEPAEKVKAEEIPKSSNSWKIASYISFVVIMGLIVLNIVPRTGNKEILDKSIVVLPFNNLSSDQENKYFIDGMMESILDNLCKIEDLRVPGRASVMQYRDNPKPIQIVAEEMDVAYVLEGSGQKIGNRLLLTVQLIIGKKDQHIWSNQYDREIEKVEDLLDIQKEIAELVVKEIEAVITPEEKELIDRIPSTSLAAHDYYLRGREEYNDYQIKNGLEALQRAENHFHKALEYDSEFALAYVGLANVYWEKHLWEEYFQTDFIDSALTLANIALSYDDELDEAYLFKGDYFREKGNKLIALNEYNKAGSINPNSWRVYVGIGELYGFDDPLIYLENNYKAATLNYGTELPGILRNIANMYHWIGFNELAYKYIQKAFHLDGDSAHYLSISGWIEFTTGDVEKAINYYKKAISLDSGSVNIYARIAGCYMASKQYDESLKYYKIWVDKLKASGTLLINEMQRVAYAYYMNGYTSEADYYFDIQMEYCNNLINTGRPTAQSFFTYYDRAGIYAFRGDKKKAYDDLKVFTQSQGYWLAGLLKSDPLFESIRDEPEFQQIVRIMEAKYQTEHERVRQWLQENDML